MRELMSRREFLQLTAAAAVAGTATGKEATVMQSRGVPGPVTTVVLHRGRPTFFLDGEPFTIPVFETYGPQVRFFRQFAEAGCRVHTFSLTFGVYYYSQPLWRGPGEYDFSPMDERAAMVLEADPGALIMPRIYLAAPEWWLDQNPEELLRLYDGSAVFPEELRTPVPKNQRFVSLASAKWRAEMSEALRRLILHIQAADYADRVFGYMFTGLFTEEWYHWSSGCELLGDYNPQMAAAFRAWLRAKYGADDALRAAWNRPDADLDSVEIPSQPERLGNRARTFRDPAREMPVIDFCLFHNDIIPQTIDHFARVVKQASGGSKAVGSFYGYMFEFAGDPEFGHNALGKLLQSEHLDFMMVTASYYNRQLGKGADYMRSPMTSVALHGKLWYHDNDTVTFRFWEMNPYQNESLERIAHEAALLGATRTPEETSWQFRRGAGFVLGAGIHQSFFDLHAGYFDDPRIMAEIGRLNRLFDEAKHYDRTSVAQILVVSDEASCSYCGFQSPWLRQTLAPLQPVLTKIGAPHDSILVDDLARLDTTPYRLVIFLNTFHLTDAQRRLIRRQVLGGRRTVLWCYAPGLFNGNRESPEAMAELTSLRIVPGPEGVAPRVELVESDHPLSRALREAGLSLMGPEGWGCRLFSVEAGEATVLGKLPGSDAVTLAVKPMGNWTSIYAVTPLLPPAFYRTLARQAGVHLYNDRDDTLYASRSYLCLNADGAGPRTLRLPRPYDVFDPFTGEQLHAGVTEFTWELQDKETMLVRVGNWE